jgi:small subunit ribosomal protein S4
VPKWLQLDKDAFQGKLVALPAREDLTMPIREQLIVELYSK